MKDETLDLKDLENGFARAESFQSDQERRSASAHALAVAHAGSGRTGREVKPVGEVATADAQPSATTMVKAATSNRVIHNRCTLGSNTSRPHGSNTSNTSLPHGSNTSHNSRPLGSSSS